MTVFEASSQSPASPLEQALENILQLALSHQNAGRLQEAEGLYRAVLQAQTDHPEANHRLGLLAVQLNQAAGGLPFLKVALDADPGQPRYWHGYIDALARTGDIEGAKKTLGRAHDCGIDSEQMAVLATALGVHAPQREPVSTLHHADAGTIREFKDEGIRSQKKTKTGLARETARPSGSGKKGEKMPPPEKISALVAMFNQGRFGDVEKQARLLTQRFPRHGFGWKALGTALQKLGRGDEALSALQLAAGLLPDDAELHSNLGNALQCKGRLADAEAVLRRATSLQPNHVMALNNLGVTLQSQRRFAEAESVLRRAVELAPDHAMALCNLGATLRDEGKLVEAEANLRQSLAIAPGSVMTWTNLGVTLQEQGRLQEAESAYIKALEIKPDHAMTYNNLGNTLNSQGRHAESEAALRRALEIDPAYTEAYNNLGNALISQGRIDEGEACYRKALATDPCHRLARANLLFALNYHPDKSPEEIFAAYRDFDTALGAPLRTEWREHRNNRETRRRLRIGYVSPDFRHHSVRHFLEPLLAHHDRTAVEVFAFAELFSEDDVTARYKSYVDHWVPTSGLSDAALAERIRAEEIDVLVDVAGHTARNRLGVFARKPTPVSLSWLGYGYTTGLRAIDYFLTDDTCAPPGSEALFAEKPWRLSTPLIPYRPAEGMGPVGPVPAAGRGHVTFGTLTRAVRINHRTIKVWAEVLRRVPGSRLVIDSANFRDEKLQATLAGRFAEYGIDRARLDIGFHTPPWDVLRGMDIGLDCFPHNSGTTLVETLYMGVPYVTLAGRPSVGLLGSSVLIGAGHPEWIARSEEEYVEIAVALASDLNKLVKIRAGLRGELEGGPLMDEAGFARKVESAYRDMFREWSENNR
ncbi:MAG TPA: tetratricopeptide repeat protein [Burkholderiaceae bacterium]|nr:tetratricopeptide repeat protein [Burkholderiaceae bacterium]